MTILETSRFLFSLVYRMCQGAGPVCDIHPCCRQTCPCRISPLLLGGSCCMPKRCLFGFMTGHLGEKKHRALCSQSSRKWAVGWPIPYPGVSDNKLTGYTLARPPANRTCRSCSEKHLLREIRGCGKIPTIMA